MKHDIRIDFLLELIKRRVLERYIGTSSQVIWLFISPLIPLVLNLIVFFYIAKIPAATSMGEVNYIIFIFTGLLPFRFIQKSASESCDLLTANLEMLKTANFPLNFLSLTAVGGLLVDMFTQISLLIILIIFTEHPLSWSIVLLPVCLILIAALSIGLSWLLSIAGYILKDLQEITGVAFGVLLYCTPTLYPQSSVPKPLEIVMALNPFTHYVIIFRDVFSVGGTFHFQSWIFSFLISLLVFTCGLIAINKARYFAGDMI